MQITKGVLTELGADAANAEKHLDHLNEAMSAHGIDTPLRIAHFLAQVAHESMLLRAVSENLNYSSDGLLKVFPKYFPSQALANSYARKPKRIANRVYASRMGNGNESSGDGYRYRGRGLIQLTGKNNYRAFSAWIGKDCVTEPDLVEDPFAAHSAVFFWDSNGLNALADADNLKTITKRINGGLNGYDDRRNLLVKAKRALSRVPTAPTGTTIRPTPMGSDESFAPTHRVVPRALNLRKTPGTASGSVIASLPHTVPRSSNWVTRAPRGGHRSARC